MPFICPGGSAESDRERRPCFEASSGRSDETSNHDLIQSEWREVRIGLCSWELENLNVKRREGRADEVVGMRDGYWVGLAGGSGRAGLMWCIILPSNQVNGKDACDVCVRACG